MRHVQAILVLVALASLPLVLLGQSAAPSGCNGMCCIRHGASRSGTGASHEGMSCHRGATAHSCQCNMKSQPGLQPALLAPLPPTMLSASLAGPVPVFARRAVVRDLPGAFSGFLPPPFEPPRA